MPSATSDRSSGSIAVIGPNGVGGFPDLPNQRSAVAIVVEANVGFERPVAGGDAVTVELVPEVGERSVRFAYDACRDGERVFSAAEQRVCAATGAEGAMALPDPLRAAIAPYVPE